MEIVLHKSHLKNMQATSKHAFLPKINKIGTRLLNQTLKTARIWVQETKKKPHN